MRICCPECQSTFPLAAGFFDADGKRLALVLADAEPTLARAVIGYLALHKPAKHALRLSRAAKLAEEVIALACRGEVCRGGLCRPASPGAFVQAIETMIEGRSKLRLPLSGHGYLTEVTFAIADKADAEAERQKEDQLRLGKRPTAPSAQAPSETPLQRQLAWINHMAGNGAFSTEEAEAERARARQKYGSDA